MKNDLFLPNVEEKAAVKSILSSLGILCAAATVIIFSALFFADVTLTFSSALDFTVDFALLFFSSYIMYFSLFDTGSEKALLLRPVCSLKEKRDALFDRYRKEGTSESIAAFCAMLSKEKTREQREVLLSQMSVSEEEAARLWKKERRSLSVADKRILRRLSRLKHIRILPNMLLSERAVSAMDVPFSSSPEKMRRRRFFRFLLPTVLTALLSVSLAAEVIRNPSADVIVGYLLKLFTLLFNGVKGFRSGYSYIACDKSAYMHEQCFWLEEYFAWLKKESVNGCIREEKE